VEFWARVRRSDESCWLWLRRPNKGGYGHLDAGGRRTLAHVFSYRLHYGEIPVGLFVCHACDVRLCVRPDHLFLGTQAENNADMCAKGRDRHPVGEANGGAKLSGSDVVAIRAARSDGATVTDLVARYRVSEATINRVIYRYTWKHLP